MLCTYKKEATRRGSPLSVVIGLVGLFLQGWFRARLRLANQAVFLVAAVYLLAFGTLHASSLAHRVFVATEPFDPSRSLLLEFGILLGGQNLLHVLVELLLHLLALLVHIAAVGLHLLAALLYKLAHLGLLRRGEVQLLHAVAGIAVETAGTAAFVLLAFLTFAEVFLVAGPVTDLVAHLGAGLVAGSHTGFIAGLVAGSLFGSCAVGIAGSLALRFGVLRHRAGALGLGGSHSASEGEGCYERHDCLFHICQF